MEKLYTIDCPEWALSALINGDNSGLTPDDALILERWKIKEGFVSADLATDSEPYFCHSPEFGLGAMCYSVGVLLDTPFVALYSVYLAPDDSGQKRRVVTAATSSDQAAKQVCDAIGAPLSAVLKVMEKRPPSGDIYRELLCDVGSQYGAPMRRRNNMPVSVCEHAAFWERTPHWDRLVGLWQGYDRGGAYWGTGKELRVRYSRDGRFWEFYRAE